MSERIIKSIDHEGFWRSSHFWNLKLGHIVTRVWAISYGSYRFKASIFTIKNMRTFFADFSLTNFYLLVETFWNDLENGTSIKLLIKLDYRLLSAAHLIYGR